MLTTQVLEESKYVSGLLWNQLQLQNAGYSYNPCATQHCKWKTEHSAGNTMLHRHEKPREQNTHKTSHLHTFFTLKKKYHDVETYLNM